MVSRNEGQDIVTLYRGEIERARLDNEAMSQRVRVTEKRHSGAQQDTAMAMEEAARSQRRAERLDGVLRAIYHDVENLHSPGCARVGVGCPACEVRAFIEDAL